MSAPTASAPTANKPAWRLAGVCLGLSGVILGAVPFIGSKYGDWVEAVAMAAGLLPLIYLGIDTVAQTRRRIEDLEARLARLDGARE